MAKKKTVDLPEEVINEILLRLPVKTVLRCKCVCKSWLSIISNPHFVTSHFQLAASPTHKLVFVESDPPITLYIDCNASLYNDSAFVSVSLDFLRRRSHPEIGGYCRGFLFLRCYNDFYLWNPSTGVNKRIPVSPITIASGSNSNNFKLLYGFGYDLSTDDYMVVVGSYKYGYTSHQESNSIDLEIFSLRANKWKQIEGDSHLPYIDPISAEVGPKVGSFLNGSIHWLAYNYETQKDVIIAFDLKEKTLSEIALPNDFSTDDFPPRIYDLLVFGGRISVWIVEMSTIKKWVMQEYEVHSSWTKTLDFSFHPPPSFSPVCFTNGGDIVGPISNGRLVKLNDQGPLLEYHSYGDLFFKRSQMAVYTESLLSLPDATEQAEDD